MVGVAVVVIVGKMVVQRSTWRGGLIVECADVRGVAPQVADFGLSREYEDTDYYRCADTDARLPIRWTAPEAITEQRFSEKSDVWAFGVTCIEIFTRAETPYRGWLNSYVIEQVLSGYRLHQPLRCPSAVYSALILPCFATATADRPPFGDLVDVCARIEASNGLVTWSSDASAQGTAVLSPEVARAIATLGTLLDPAVVASIVQRARRHSFKLEGAGDMGDNFSDGSANTSTKDLSGHFAALLRAAHRTSTVGSRASGKSSGTLSLTEEEDKVVQYIRISDRMRDGDLGPGTGGKRVCIYAPITRTPEGTVCAVDIQNASPWVTSHAPLAGLGGEHVGKGGGDVHTSSAVPHPVVYGDAGTLEEIIYDCPTATTSGGCTPAVHVSQPLQHFAVSGLGTGSDAVRWTSDPAVMPRTSAGTQCTSDVGVCSVGCGGGSLTVYPAHRAGIVCFLCSLWLVFHASTKQLYSPLPLSGLRY